MILTTVGEMSSMSFMSSYMIGRTSLTNRGQYAGLYTIAWSVAQVIGPIGGSQVAEHAGFPVLWWIVGGVCVVAAIGFRSLQKNKIPVHE